MIIREVYPEEKDLYNRVVNHPLQSWEWGKFREKTGLKVLRLGVFDKNNLLDGLQISFHPIPKTKYFVGYIPKCNLPSQALLEALKKMGEENNCLFIKLEPNTTSGKEILIKNGCVYGRPLFTKFTFRLNLDQEVNTLFNNLKSKTRYNVRLAQKYGVEITGDNSAKAFSDYLKLTFETTKRQKFYAHNQNYHLLMWETLMPTGIAHLLKATYQNKVLATWILFVFNKVLYYPYGASSRENREVMASNLMMWGVILFGKKMGCHVFDMWGSLGPNPNSKDPWYGFHRFKEGYNPSLVEYIGTFDLVINPSLYKLYNIVENLRWKYLRFKSRFS